MSKFVRATDPHDPNRCQSRNAVGDGRCPFMAVQDAFGNYLKYCPRHGGTVQQVMADRKQRTLYDLNKWTDRVNKFQKHEEARTITAELALLRLLLEERFNQCHTEIDLIYHGGSISDIIIKIKDLVLTVAKLEKQAGLFIDKFAVEALADRLLNIVLENVKDSTALEIIADRFGEELEKLKNANIEGNIRRENSQRPKAELSEDLHPMDSEEPD